MKILRLVPRLIKTFPAHNEGITCTGYPRGYSDLLKDMDHRNPTLSVSTLRILGIEEGPVSNVVKAYLKYQFSPREYAVALHTIAFQGRFKFAVDQDGCLYLRFDRERDAEIQALLHHSCAGCFVKFYKVASVKKLEAWKDKAVQARVVSRAEGQPEGQIAWETRA